MMLILSITDVKNDIVFEYHLKYPEISNKSFCIVVAQIKLDFCPVNWIFTESREEVKEGRATLLGCNMINSRMD